MRKHCGNCANYVWGDKKTPPPHACATCITEHAPNGDLLPSNWKAKPRTNADRIRSMSDEELAHMLLQVDGYATYCKNIDKCIERVDRGEDIPDSECEACILRWLQQPVREEKHER